ncbi:MAG: extracellular solute-binding protein [Bacteroidota bacterium]
MRIWSSVTSFIVATLCGLSCTGGGSPGGEITVAIALLSSEQPAYRLVLNQFTEETGIHVRLIVQQYQQVREALEAEVRAGQGQLDLVELDVYMLAQVYRSVLPLDSLVGTFSAIREVVDSAAFRAGSPPEADGWTHFLPHRLNWQAMVYDASLLSQPPGTWDELLDVCRQHAGAIGFKASRYEGMVCDFFPFLWQSGGDPLQPRSSGSLRALRFLKQISPTLNPAVRSYKEVSILQAQERQEVILHFNWPFVVPLVRKKGLMRSRIRVAPLPAGPAGSVTVLGGGYLGIPRTAPHPSEAALLVDFLLSEQVQRRLTRDLGWFPVRDAGWEELSEDDRIDFSGYLEMRGGLRARPAVPHYGEISRIWQQGFSDLLFEGKSADEVAAFVESRLEELGEAHRP